MSSDAFMNFIAPVIAAAHTSLANGRRLDAPVEARVALIVAARIIEADMLAEMTPAPDEDKMKHLVDLTRAEIERIYTAKWARH